MMHHRYQPRDHQLSKLQLESKNILFFATNFAHFAVKPKI